MDFFLKIFDGNSGSTCQRTVLYLAAFNGNKEILEFLLKYGAKKDTKKQEGDIDHHLYN